MDRFSILKSLKAVEIVVFAGSSFVEAFFAQVYPFTQGATETDSNYCACPACFAHMSGMKYVHSSCVFKCVEIFSVLFLDTDATEVVILNDVRFESFFP